MRKTALALALAGIASGWAPLAAQRSTLTSADSALVARLLLAEENRDTSAAAYADGMKHADARIRVIARRGYLRSRDAAFARRDSLPALPAPPVYPEPAWRLRYRALGARNDKCGELLQALRDSTWQVRLRGADLVTSACATDMEISNILHGWIRDVPASTARAKDGVSWHAAAHGLTALAKIAQADARTALPHFTTSTIYQ